MSTFNSILLIHVLFLSVTPDHKKMREYYVLMSKNENSAQALNELSKKNTSVPVNISTAYYGASQMALAKYKVNPISQLNSFNTGKKLLEKAVQSDTSSIEVRYIRLSIQQNAPAFLNYHSDIVSDRHYLVHHLKFTRSIDPDLFSAVYAYLVTRCQLTESEKILLR